MCIDINECEEDAHNCTDVCVNVQGGFKCACNQGYTLADPTSCTGKGNDKFKHKLTNLLRWITTIYTRRYDARAE